MKKIKYLLLVAFSIFIVTGVDASNDIDGDNIVPELIFDVSLFVVFIIGFIIYDKFFLSIPQKSNEGKYGYRNNQKIDKKNVQVFSNIPCNKDIYYANSLIYLNNFGYEDTNIFCSILLKWVKDKKIEFKKNESSSEFSYVINLNINSNFDDNYEKELFDMLVSVSKDGILEVDKFENWCVGNCSKFLKFFENLNKNKIEKLKKDNHIYKRDTKSECKSLYIMDDIIYKDSTELYGLKIFFENLLKKDEKEVAKIDGLDEYIMFACLFGIAFDNKFVEKIKNLYPEVFEKEGLDYEEIIFVNDFFLRIVCAASGASGLSPSDKRLGG